MKDVCRLFGLSPISKPMTNRRGFEGSRNRGHLVATDKKRKIFVKWARGEKDNLTAEVQKQKLFNKYARSSVVRAPVWFYTKRKGGYTMSAFEYVDPRHHTLTSEKFLQVILQTLAEFKRIAINNLNKVYPVKIFEQYRSELHTMLKGLEEGGRTTGQQTQRYLDYFTSTAKGGLLSFTHADFAPHNFTINNESVLILFDFEKSVIGHPLEDLARLINFYMIHNPRVCKLLLRSNHASNKAGLGGYRLLKAVYLANHYSAKHQQTSNPLPLIQTNFWINIAERLVDGTNPLSESERAALLRQEQQHLTNEELDDQKMYL